MIDPVYKRLLAENAWLKEQIALLQETSGNRGDTQYGNNKFKSPKSTPEEKEADRILGLKIRAANTRGMSHESEAFKTWWKENGTKVTNGEMPAAKPEEE